MSTARPLFTQLSVAAAAVVLAVGINWTVDPFGLFGNNTAGFFYGSERQIKQGLAGLHAADGIILGSSKVAEIDPAHVSVPLVNGAWSGALPEEMLDFLVTRDNDWSFVAVGLDFFMFNEANIPFVEDTEMRRGDLRRAIGHGANLAMLYRSLRALQWAAAGRAPAITALGARNVGDEEAADRASDGDGAAAIEGLSQMFRGYAYSERRAAAVARIRDWARDNCVPLVAFVNPLHRDVRAMFTEVGVEADFRRFQAMLREVFPDLVDLSGPDYADPDLYWRREPFHYYPATGTIIFERALLPAIAVKMAERAACVPAAAAES